MKKKRFRTKLSAVLLVAGLLLTGTTGCGSEKENSSTNESGTNVQMEALDIEVEFKDEDLEDSWDESSAAAITLSDGEIKISGDGAVTSNGNVTISKAGTYVLTGSLSNGQILVEAGDEELVRLVLNGVDIYCEDSAPIYVKNADKTVITLAEGSENTLTDGKSYTLDAEEEPNGTIFSKDDLTINGSGKLVVSANYNNGIVSKDDLKLVNGDITITAVKNGMKGKDSVAIRDGSYTVTSGADGIKANNSTDADKGYVYIENGTFAVTSTEDAFHSDATMAIYGGTFRIETEDDGFHSDASLLIADGTIDITKSYEGIESAVIYIQGGDISVVSSDDAINAAGGELADSQSGAETDGQDGFNQSSTQTEEKSDFRRNGGTDASAGKMGGPMGGGMGGMMETSTGYLYISGGNITIDAEGDGIDSNTNVEMSGGYVVVNGPTNDGNGSLDYGSSFAVTGGTLIATGSSGMATVPTSETTVNTAFVGFAGAAAGSTIRILDSNGNEVLSTTPTKNYSSLIYSSDLLKSDEEYTVTIGGETVATFTMSNTVTTAGNVSAGGNMGGGMGGQPNGNMGGGRMGGRMGGRTDGSQSGNGQMIPPTDNPNGGSADNTL